MKKVLFVVSFLCFLLFSLASCSSDKGIKMTVDGVEIKEGVYNYYLDEAEKEIGDKEKVDEIALQKCREFAAAQILLKEKNLSVRTYIKRKTAEDTEALCIMFSEHYNDNDIL